MTAHPRILLFLKRIVKAVLPRRLYDKMRAFYFSHFALQRVGPHTGRPEAEACLPFGINLFLYNTNDSGGVEAHLLRSALTAAGIPYRTIDLSNPEKFNSEKENITLYRVNLVIVHAASGTPGRLHLFDIDFGKHYNIAYWAWELKELPDVFCTGYEVFQEVWTISGFCTAALEKKSRIPVLTIPLCANPDREVLQNGRDYFHMDKDAFLFMFAYDCNSFVSRKNPQAVVQAFLKAFPPEDDRVGLVLKLLYPESAREHVEELKKTLSPYRNIYYISNYLSYEEMRTLLQVSDAFVTLHRAEGFGNLPLEAMSLGTPVISTEWSGNMEYMNHRNAALVGCTMVPVNGQYVGSTPGDGLVWAEPDIDEAADYMRRMVSDRQWRDSLIAHGDYTANTCFTAKVIGKMMRDRLEFLHLKQ